MTPTLFGLHALPGLSTLVLLGLLSPAITLTDCTEAEGDDPGECDDGADNDQDGDFDCNDADCFGAPVCVDTEGALELGIPAYFYPGQEWAQATEAASAFGVLIANAHNGPGDQVDANYTAVIDDALAAGIQIYGYVHTQYGTRSDSLVRGDIDRWYAFYPNIDGIFFDEVAGSGSCEAQEDNYLGWSNYVHAQDDTAKISLNPGTSTCESYMDFSDSIMIFEDDVTHFMAWEPPTWAENYTQNRFWVLVHDTPKASLEAVLARTRGFGIGRVYVTDDGGSNPWDTLPSYWEDLVALVSASN